MTTLEPGAATLHSASVTSVTLPDAIRRADLVDAVALLASPRTYTVARLGGGQLTGPGDVALPDADLAAVFEARVFHADAELRWLHTGNGAGAAALLSESADRCTAFGPLLPALESIDTIDNRYLLWGQPLNPDSGVTPTAGPVWVRLAAAKIGLLEVPVPRAPRPGECVYLRTVEYITTEPDHGNAGIAEERLTGLYPDIPRPAGAAGVPVSTRSEG